jgi:hypothetical protein
MFMKYTLFLTKLILLFFYLVLLYFFLPLWTIIWKELIKYSCEFYTCTNIVYPDIVPYITINYITIPNFIFFILPLWIIIGTSWFFVFKKLYSDIEKKKYTKVLVYLLVTWILIWIFCFVSWLWLLIIEHETELKLNDFILEYSSEIKRWPLKLLSDIF